MRSTFGGLNTVVRGLAAQQVALDTVGHNISNANTEGYSRQSVNLVTTRSQSVYGANGENQIGTGVNVDSITRARNTFIDRQMWKESSSLNYGEAVSDLLGRVEGVFHEPSETGVQTTMDKFWKAWQTLATNASDDGTRTTVRQRGVEMVDAIQHATTQLTDMVADTNSVIDIKVGKMNQLSSEVYSLNRQIVVIEAGGTDQANDLRDKRDLLVDKMSEIANVTVTEDKYGNYIIQSAGVSLVDGGGYRKLATNSVSDPDYGYEIKNVVVQGSTQALTFTDGELRGLLEMRDSVAATNSYDGIKGYLKKLEKVSEFLLKDFNDVHKAGLGTDNSTGTNFFGAAATDYNTFTPPVPASTMGWIAEIKVNPALFNTTDGLSKIAAKTSINSLSIQQSNATGGAAKVNSLYTGTTPLNYQTKIGAVGALGEVTSISYSLDNWLTSATATPVVPATTPATFTLRSLPDTVTIAITTDIHNKKDDIYTFSVNQGNASGDNAVKLANCMKIDNPLSTTLGGSSLDSFYNSLIGALGVQSQSATTMTANQKTLVNQIENWRQSVSGVNVDEELSNMIRFQKGYAAAARVLTSMDEMLDKLINGTGVVGR